MRIKPIQPGLFRASADSRVAALFDIVEVQLPQQCSSEFEAALTENIASAAQGIMTFTLVSNVAASVFLYAIIFYLWSLIN